MKLSIEKLVYGGDGLARLAVDEQGRRKAAFVPFVIEGEEVEAGIREDGKSFARAELIQVTKPSPERVEPGCPYFQRCGGCHYQHISYAHQLEVKAGILRENLQRIAKIELPVELQVHAGEPWTYRNRVRLKVQSKSEFALGYFKFNSHDLLPVERCPISSPLINRAIAALWQVRPSGVREIELFANAEDSQLLVEIYGDQPQNGFAEDLKRVLPEVCDVVAFSSPAGAGHRSSTAEAASLPRSAELVYNTKLGSYRIAAGAFFQVNRYLTDELVDIVTSGQSGKTALDLYAGGGLFATVLSREFERVIAVESSPISYSDLRYNSPRNVKAVRAMSAEYLQQVAGKLKPDLVVMDPPRAGLGESVVHRLVSLGAPRMIYVSCDPATLSRDLGGLLKAGYRIGQAHLVDLFPQTYHMESVFHLIR